MKHLIRDLELVAYLEGELDKEEVIILKRKLKENGELSMLYHLQLAYDEGMEEYANYLIGKDDFCTQPIKKPFIDLKLDGEYRMVANNKKPEK